MPILRLGKRGKGRGVSPFAGNVEDGVGCYRFHVWTLVKHEADTDIFGPCAFLLLLVSPLIFLAWVTHGGC